MQRKNLLYSMLLVSMLCASGSKDMQVRSMTVQDKLKSQMRFILHATNALKNIKPGDEQKTVTIIKDMLISAIYSVEHILWTYGVNTHTKFIM